MQPSAQSALVMLFAIAWWRFAVSARSSAATNMLTDDDTATAGLEALRNSISTLMAELSARDKTIDELREESALRRDECHRLRKELNVAMAAKAESMADVAMAASVQALNDEGEHQRRALIETSILCDELRSTESRLDWSERLELR